MRKTFLAIPLVAAAPALAMAQSQTATTPNSSNPVLNGQPNTPVHR